MRSFFRNKAIVSAHSLQNFIKNEEKITCFDFSGFVGSDKVKDYLTHREEYAKIGRGTGFDDAVKKMDEYISNPLVCFYSK